jgi:murein DD-endopeptidase MepM/ murein hydrolase activator NlpD
MVKLRTSTGQHLYFGHMQKILCKKGDRVKKGQVLGTVGSSGRATGPHLHFSVKSSGKFINPTRLLSPLR